MFKLFVCNCVKIKTIANLYAKSHDFNNNLKKKLKFDIMLLCTKFLLHILCVRNKSIIVFRATGYIKNMDIDYLSL